MLTTTLTLLLFTLGPVLALFGVAGFLGCWTSAPDHDSIRYVQVLATSGRRMTYAGLALYLIHHGLPISVRPAARRSPRLPARRGTAQRAGCYRRRQPVKAAAPGNGPLHLSRGGTKRLTENTRTLNPPAE